MHDYFKVSLPNGVGIWWDGKSRAYFDVPGSFKGQLRVRYFKCSSSLFIHSIYQGLCGTFSGNQFDDFLTPDGDIEDSPTGFANKLVFDFFNLYNENLSQIVKISFLISNNLVLRHLDNQIIRPIYFKLDEINVTPFLQIKLISNRLCSWNFSVLWKSKL